MSGWWLGALQACRPPAVEIADLSVRPSTWVPAAFRVEWTGPAGTASLWAVDHTDLSETDLELLPDQLGLPWRKVSSAEVDEGPAGLPLALLPVGEEYRLRVGVVAADGIEQWSEVGTVEIPEAPEEIGNPGLLNVDRARSQLAGGWIVTQRYAGVPFPSEAYALILDPEGKVVWWLDPLPTGQRVIRTRPGLDRHSVLVLQDHDTGEDLVQRVSLDGEVLTETPTPDVSHDFVENADGTLTWVAYDLSDGPLIPRVPWPVATDVLRTGAEGGGDIVDGFDFFDDFPGEPSLVCYHTEPDLFVAGAVDWTHTNTLIRAPDGDGWLVGVRHLDALLQVGDDGVRRWQAGGADATLTPSTDAALFQHGHASDAWSDGEADHVLMFDNGDHSPQPIVSRVVELRIDPGAGTFEAVWELPDPKGRFTSFLGDARRLPGGNTLVSWTSWGELVEYTPEGDEVWRVEGDERFGRSTWVPELIP